MKTWQELQENYVELLRFLCSFTFQLKSAWIHFFLGWNETGNVSAPSVMSLRFSIASALWIFHPNLLSVNETSRNENFHHTANYAFIQSISYSIFSNYVNIIWVLKSRFRGHWLKINRRNQSPLSCIVNSECSKRSALKMTAKYVTASIFNVWHAASPKAFQHRLHSIIFNTRSANADVLHGNHGNGSGWIWRLNK